MLADIAIRTSTMDKSRGMKDVIIDLIDPDSKRMDLDVALMNTNQFNVQFYIAGFSKFDRRRRRKGQTQGRYVRQRN